MEWKIIDGFNGKYDVSNRGLIRSRLSNKLMSVQDNGRGYKYTKLLSKKHVYYHRVVADAFIPNPNNLPQVNHINGIKSDNRVENLEWCDNSYNHAHAKKLGLLTGKKDSHGIKNSNYKHGLNEVVKEVKSCPECGLLFSNKQRKVIYCSKI